LTTSSETAARVIDATTYCLEGLSDDESLDLLMNFVFKINSKSVLNILFPSLLSVAKEISKKCVGHPLTIRCNIIQILYRYNLITNCSL
jgi:hypothetical protein